MPTNSPDEIERALAEGPLKCEWLKYPPAPACPCELREPPICATCERNALLETIREREAGLRKQHAEDMRVQVALDLKHLARIKAICDGDGSPQDSGDSPEMLSARVIVIKLAQRDEELERHREKDGGRTREHNLLVKENREQFSELELLRRLEREARHQAGEVGGDDYHQALANYDRFLATQATAALAAAEGEKWT